MMSNMALKLSLVVSLMVNAFLIGAGVHFLDHPPGPPPRELGKMLEHFTKGLSDEDSAILKQAFEKEHLDQDMGPSDPHEFHKQIEEALRADPFDPGRLQTIFENEGLRHATFGVTLGRAMSSAAQQMSVQGRHHLAEERPRH